MCCVAAALEHYNCVLCVLAHDDGRVTHVGRLPIENNKKKQYYFSTRTLVLRGRRVFFSLDSIIIFVCAYYNVVIIIAYTTRHAN